MLLSKATYIAFKVYVYSVDAFPGNQTHDLGVANDIRICFIWNRAFLVYFYKHLKVTITTIKGIVHLQLAGPHWIA